MTLADFQARLGYTFDDVALLEAALTHSSHGTANYERLEFLGDRVLGLLVGNWLWEVFPAAEEGELSRRHMAMVRESALVAVAERWALGDVVKLGPGEGLKASIVADVVEALLGAVWLDGGYDAANTLVRAHWDVDFEDAKDAKTRLQELLQGQGHGLPLYSVVDEVGPAHERIFQVKVACGLGEAVGQGRSKQAAGADAAAHLLKKLEG